MKTGEEKTPTVYWCADDIVLRPSERVKCTISGNTCSEVDGARICSCVGCTVWRSRESSVVDIYELPPTGEILPSNFSVTIQARGTR